MAWFNAPIPQADHTLRAVRAALAMRNSVAALNELPASRAHAFGVGIHVGDAVLGLIGTKNAWTIRRSAIASIRPSASRKTPGRARSW